MAECENCGVYRPAPFESGYCDECESSPAVCSECHEELWLSDLNDDGICGACEDEMGNQECDCCGDSVSREDYDAFGGICETCASQGY